MPVRNKMQRQLDLVRTAEMYCQGMPQVAIAKEIGITQPAIVNDLKVIRKEWAERRVASFDQHVSNELAKIDNLERVAWEAWEASQLPSQRTSERVVDGISSIRNTSEKRDGNPAFLAQVERCIEKRIKLMGLNAPEMIALTDWRRSAVEQGVDPEAIHEALVLEFVEAMREPERD